MSKLILLFVLPALAACGPIGRFPGGPLRGEVVTDPVTDWSFTEEYQTIEVETRPSFPHSITTVCFTHAGQLYIPSRNPREKRWPRYVLDDPRIRLRIGGQIYERRAVRVSDTLELEELFGALGRKYKRLQQAHLSKRPELWFFRVEPRV